MLMLFRLLILVTQFKKTEYDAKIKETEHKIIDHSVYITTNTFNKFSDVLFDESLKQEKLGTNKYLNTVEQHAIKNDKKVWLKLFLFSK